MQPMNPTRSSRVWFHMHCNYLMLKLLEDVVGILQHKESR
jgi:hypothetical protein